MKLIKINEKHYVIVDDSIIHQHNYCCHIVTKNITQQVNNSCYGDWKKIIFSTQPLNKSFNDIFEPKYLDLEKIHNLIGILDIQKKAMDWFNEAKYNSAFIADPSSYIRGYKQALEDNKKKKYTEEELLDAWELGALEGGSLTKRKKETLFKSFPQDMWDVEFDEDGNLQLMYE